MYLRNHWLLYAMLILPIVYYVLFQYFPMYGLLIAFKDYNLFKGVWDSPWVGFKVFEEVFRTSNFWSSIKNTLVLNGLNLLIGFPAPIILALMLNEINNGIFKKGIQTVLYLPHFISWVIIGGMMYQIFSTTSGMINSVVKLFGGEPIFFLSDPKYFRGIVVISDIWKEAGYGTIIYLAAITGIDPTLYEAGRIDGASRWQSMRYITLPCISETIVVMLLLDIGRIMNVGFEQIYVLANSAVYSTGDVISTYVYRLGIGSGRFSLTTAIGLFQSVIGFVMILSCNAISRKVADKGLW